MKEFAKGMSSRFLAVLLMLCILLGSVELPAMAAEDYMHWDCPYCGGKTTAKPEGTVGSEYARPNGALEHYWYQIYTVTCYHCNQVFQQEQHVPYGNGYKASAHHFITNASGQDVCEDCGYVMASSSCDHIGYDRLTMNEVYTDWEYFSDTKHQRTHRYDEVCDHCKNIIRPVSELQTEDHNFRKGKCKDCDYECPHNDDDLVAEFQGYYDTDDTYHTPIYRNKCENCGAYVGSEYPSESKRQKHTFGSDGICTVCDYTSAPQVPSISFTKMSPTTVQVGNKVTFTVETTGDIVEMIIKYYPLDANGNPDTEKQKTIREEYSANATIERSFSEKGDKIISFRARYSGSDEWSAESSQKTLTVTSKGALDKPVVTAPESVILGNSWNVSWTAVNHADYYRLQITDPNGPTRLFEKEFSGSVHSYTVPADAIKSPVRASVYVIATSNEGYDQAESELVYTTLYTCSHTNPDRTEASRALDQSKTTASQHVYTVTYNVTCKDCGAALPSETENEAEAHTFNASGVCRVCGYQRINNLTVSVKADKTTAEVGKTIGATATPSGGDGSYNYSWVVMRDGAETYSTTTGYPAHFELVVDVIGQYVLVATVTDSSGKTATAQSESITVKEKQPAVITSFTMKEESVFVGEDVHFTVSTNADEIQIVVEGAGTFDSDIKQVGTNGTVSFTRTFSQAGKRVISFHARYQGDSEWGALYDQPKTLTVNELSIPAFSLINVKCASSDTNVGSVGDDVKVTWNPPVWQSDPSMKPDRYVIWISGPGVPYNEDLKANYQAEREDDGSATEHTFSGSKYTLKEGNYTIDVYAVIDDPEYKAKMASGNNNFTIAKPKLDITTKATEKTVVVNGTTSSGVDNVKIFLTEKGKAEVAWTSDPVKVSGNAFSLPLPSELFDNNQVYIVEAKGYKEDMDDVVVATSNKETASLRDGSIKRVSIHEAGSSIAEPGPKIGELNGTITTVETTATKLKFYIYPVKGETLNAATVQVDNGIIERAAWQDGTDCYLRTITLTPGTHTIKVRNKDGIGITGKIIVKDLNDGWQFERYREFGRDFLHIWNSNRSIGGEDKINKSYIIGVAKSDDLAHWNSADNYKSIMLDHASNYEQHVDLQNDLHVRDGNPCTIVIVDESTMKPVKSYYFVPDGFNIIIAPTEGDVIDLNKIEGLQLEFKKVEGAKSYEIVLEVTDPKNNRKVEVYRNKLTTEWIEQYMKKVTQNIVKLIINKNTFSSLPEGNLSATITITVNR